MAWSAAVALSLIGIYAAPAFADYTATGKFLYQDRIFNSSIGFTGATVNRPIRYADVWIMAGTTTLAKGATGADGSFSINVPGSTSQAIKAVCYASSVLTPAIQMEVKTYYGSFTASSIYSYSSSTVNYQGTSTLEMGETNIAYTSDAGKAFNIWDVSYDGMEFLASSSVGTLPTTKLTILWKSGGDVRSFYYGAGTTRWAHIGTQSGYDDTVILHQFGQFVADVMSKLDNSTDLPNQGVPIYYSSLLTSIDDVRVAWREGFGMFFGASVRKFKGYANPAAYVFTDGTNLLFTADVSAATISVPVPRIKGSTDILSVAAALWGINNGTLQLPFSDVWEVVSKYIPAVTHTGINAEDFWDGWFSPDINNGFSSEMQTIFAGQNGIEFYADSQEPDNDTGTAPTVSVAPFTPSGGSKVVITEVTLGSISSIELFNAGDADADITGWTVSATRRSAVSALLTIPPFRLRAGAFVLLTGAQGINSSSILYFNTSLPWLNGSDGACALRDSSTGGRDFVRWGDSTEFPPGGVSFTGTNPPSPAVGKTLGRSYAGTSTGAAGDWTVQDPSPGDFNTTGLEKHHTYYPAGDVDYVAFNAVAGNTYVLETVNLTNGADTILDLLAPDGKQVLATSDDHAQMKSSRIVWTAPYSGKFYLYSHRFSGVPQIARYGAYDIRMIESSFALPTGGPEILTVSKPGNGGLYQTITDAIAAAGNGDIVKIIDSETYSESLSIFGKAITLMAATGKLPVIDGRGRTDLTTVIVQGAKSVQLQGLTILAGYRGVYLGSGSSRVEGLKILGGLNGIVVAGGSATIRSSLVNRATGSLSNAPDGIQVTGAGTSATIVNCTSVNNRQAGVAVYGTASARVINSIVTSNTVLDVGGDSAKQWTLVVKNSDVPKSEYVGKDGNINTDPKFVNAASDDYHLQKDSPAVDKGDSGDADLPACDAEGRPRSLDGSGGGKTLPDMGAYEYLNLSTLPSSAVFPQIAVGGAAGGEYRTVIYGMNTASQPVVFNSTLTKSDGTPLSVDTPGGSGSSFNIVMSPMGTSRLEASLPGTTTAGYALLGSNLPMGGSALFKVMNGDKVVSEAGVGLSKPTKSFTVYIDNTNNAFSGYAIANFGTSPANLTLTLRNQAGTRVDSLALTIPAGQHLAKFAVEHFPLTAPAGFEGSLEATSDQSVAAVALRYDNPLMDVFSTIPVLVDEASTTLYFPQAADGSGYRTSFILINPEDAATTAKMEFFADDGSPLYLPIGGSLQSSVDVPLAARGTARLITDGTSSGIKVGWVKVTAPTKVGGSSIFQTADKGIITSEAGVAASPLATHFTTYVESLGATQSGLAISNPVTSEAVVTLNLRDADGAVVATTKLKLPALGHVAKFFWQWFPLGFDEFSGTLEVVASSWVSGVALRYDNTEANVFATLPVVIIP
jgi:hypothetical protein